MDFNEDDTVKYIKNALGSDFAQADDDEILNIIDIIWDYYDENGLLDLDNDDDLDEEALMAYVRKMTARDRSCPFSADEVEHIVRAELDFENEYF